MMTTDSLHPPSGAVAITAVLGGDAVHRLGFTLFYIPYYSTHYFTLFCCLFQSIDWASLSDYSACQ
jgi:CBS domain-containing membrane protein